MAEHTVADGRQFAPHDSPATAGSAQREAGTIEFHTLEAEQPGWWATWLHRVERAGQGVLVLFGVRHCAPQPKGSQLQGVQDSPKGLRGSIGQAAAHRYCHSSERVCAASDDRRRRGGHRRSRSPGLQHGHRDQGRVTSDGVITSKRSVTTRAHDRRNERM